MATTKTIMVRGTVPERVIRCICVIKASLKPGEKMVQIEIPRHWYEAMLIVWAAWAGTPGPPRLCGYGVGESPDAHVHYRTLSSNERPA